MRWWALGVAATLAWTGCAADGDEPGRDAGSQDAGPRDAAMQDAGHGGQGCAVDTDCTENVGGPPVNACLRVGGVGQCVFRCSTDADCLAPFYAACGGRTDDGTQVCTFTAPADAGRDATTADAGDGATRLDAGTGLDAGAASGCTGSGGTVAQALCCASTEPFPDTCAIGACGCAPGSSHTVEVCQCPMGTCFDGTRCQ